MMDIEYYRNKIRKPYTGKGLKTQKRRNKLLTLFAAYDLPFNIYFMQR